MLKDNTILGGHITIPVLAGTSPIFLTNSAMLEAGISHVRFWLRMILMIVAAFIKDFYGMHMILSVHCSSQTIAGAM